MNILIFLVLHSLALKPYWYLDLKFQPIEYTFYASSNIIENDSSQYIFYSFNETSIGGEIKIDNNNYILIHSTLFSSKGHFHPVLPWVLTEQNIFMNLKL